MSAMNSVQQRNRELADQIKTLRAAHTIEGTPQRIRQKHSSAEEPVTARILRRPQAASVTDDEEEEGAWTLKMAETRRVLEYSDFLFAVFADPERRLIGFARVRTGS